MNIRYAAIAADWSMTIKVRSRPEAVIHDLFRYQSLAADFNLKLMR
jgi:hypothetical protein